MQPNISTNDIAFIIYNTVIKKECGKQKDPLDLISKIQKVIDNNL